MEFLTKIDKHFVWVFLSAIVIGYLFPIFSVFSFATTFMIALGLFIASLKVDFGVLFKHLIDFKYFLPRYFAIKVILPLLVFFATMLVFPQFALGAMLIIALPSGLSNVIFADIFKGNKESSLLFTIISHLFSPIVIPLLLLVVSLQNISFDYFGLFFSLLAIVIIPLTLAFFAKKKFEYTIKSVSKYVSGINILLFALIVIIIIAQNSYQFSNLSILIIPLIFTFLLFFVFFLYALIVARNESKENKVAMTLTAVHPNFTLGLVIANTYFSFEVLTVVIAGTLTVDLFFICYKIIMDKFIH